MKRIDNLTDDASQTVHILLDDGKVIDLTLIYLATIQHWKFDLVHPDLTVYGKMLCNHPNILRQFKKVVNFGLGCIVKDNTEPINVEDFTSGRVLLYILNSTEVNYVENLITNG